MLGGYDPDALRDRAAVGDGRRTAPQVPISLVHRRDRPAGGPRPLLYGYGSYEVVDGPRLLVASACRCSTAASCSPSPTSAAAARWAGAGTTTASSWRKRNTFTDFIACAEHLVREGWTTPDAAGDPRRLAPAGCSWAPSSNLRPDLFGAVVAEVPFVDALTTILDPTLPLTVTEWEEWGNPVDVARGLRAT